ncbi:hypothetical protein [Seongchinamella sediminis]|uniref:hypothetical protein n=1 Tax=Seongchinamella sediminis TaxID=2283635 RepID=UPI0010589374|nr:hypothetical protein [Seongchinamella sediminis]
MNKEDKVLIDRFGITCEKINIYHYKKYQYSKLQDAINYAKLEHGRSDVKPAMEIESETRLVQSGQDQS